MKEIPKIKISKKIGVFLVLVIIVILAGSGILIYQHYHTSQKADPSSNSSPTATITPVQSSFSLEIPKIGVTAPVIQSVDGKNEAVYDKALEGGVAQFQGTSLPGGNGNIFIFGHSSADKAGPYSKIFASLNDLVSGDQIKVNFNGKEYGYTVQSKKIVNANDLSPLDKTTSEQLTLMTCWPIGTDQKRLIVIAKPD